MPTLQEQIDAASDLDSALNVLSPAAKDWEAGVRTAETKATDALTGVLAGVYSIGLRFGFTSKAYADALWDRQIAKAAPGGNPWLQAFYMATGEFDHSADKVVTKDPDHEGKKLTRTKFVKGTMLQKYAGALRYLEQQSITVEGIPDYVRSFKDNHPTGPGGWGGIVKAELDARKAAGTASSRNVHDVKLLELAENALLDAAPKEVRERATKGKERKFARAWGVMVDGEFLFGGVVKDSESAAKTEAVAFAKSIEQAKENDEEPVTKDARVEASERDDAPNSEPLAEAAA
ncbi:MAG: hypothetical protein Q7U72_08305 [Brevundimonas sp.]|uniref:hypothetical protein n=1 Tax=Brevundimonas sp. TaxID=1871086 RepID=UPI0027289279|nr:hypothetical protein [Brevundimonas sp.]MDO9077435.1 hypothetical protein [Brevundimonas sp.]MDZ4062683.1 hypothetical protein [Brevundimonas sp.]